MPFLSSSERRIGALLLAGALTLGSLVVPETANAQRRSAATASSAPLPILLHRARTVGQRSHVVIESTGEQTTQVRLGRRVVQDVHTVRHVTLEADVTVRSVAPNGKPLDERYVVTRLVQTVDGGAEASVLPAGTVIDVHRVVDGEGTILIAGAAPSEEAAPALDLVLSDSASSETDDQTFGSTTPRRVGESWDADGARLSSSLRRETNIEATLGGRATLTSAERVDGADCAVVDVRIAGTLTALPDMPAGAIIRNGTIGVTLHGAFPTDATRTPPDTTMGMNMTVDVDFDAEGQPASLHMVVTNQRHERTRALP